MANGLAVIRVDGTEVSLPGHFDAARLIPENPKHFVGPAQRFLIRLIPGRQLQFHASKMGNALRGRQVGLALPQLLFRLFSAGNVPVQADDSDNRIALINQGNLGGVEHFHGSLSVDRRSLGFHRRPAGANHFHVIRGQGDGPFLREQIEDRFSQ
jgi:hypothetical protein